MSKHNRQDPIPYEPPTTKRQRIEGEAEYPTLSRTPPHPHHGIGNNNNSRNGTASPNFNSPQPGVGSSSGGPATAKPRYSPADLLNPKAAAAARLAGTTGASTASGSSSGNGSPVGRDGRMQQLQQHGQAGMNAANMLLNLHGVTERHTPLRQNLWSRGGGAGDYYGNGGTSDYRGGFVGGNRGSSGLLTIPRAEGSPSPGFYGIRGVEKSATPEIQFLDQMIQSPPKSKGNSVVDLTADDDNDDIIYSGTKSLSPIVCYGMIVKVSASISIIPDPPSNINPALLTRTWPKIQVQLARGDTRTYVVNLITMSGKNVGSLRGANAKAMASLMDLGLVDTCQAVIMPRYKGFEVAGQPTSQTVDMTVTLYGTDANAKKVGNLLGQHNLFLQDPIDKDPKYQYRNPQYPEPTSGNAFVAAADRAKLGKATYSVRTTEEVKNEITSVLDSLEKAQMLEETEPDPRIETSLLPHQKQGLNFMLKKEAERTYEPGEDSSFWNMKLSPGGVKMYHNVITGLQTRSKPPACLGGILADDMGLGKTLTVLSLIVKTFAEATAFGKKRKSATPASDHDLSTMYAKSTLLICPLSVLVNWEEQIKMHVKPDTISYYVYHGNNRVSDLKELAKYDMVITTYALAASDFGKAQKDNGSVLQKIHWFRIVLDEAHTIREQNTVQSKAICNLEASRRWAVTGTPVQNRLDDLGTLIKFLRLSPFDKRAEFNQFISAPLKSGDPTSMDKLRVLVDTITLRRRKDRIDLPPKRDTTVRLRFSPDEQELYDATSRQSRYKIDMVAKSGHLGGKAYVHVLQTILRLRMICASRDLLGDEDTAGLVSSNAIDIDSLPADEETFAMGKKQAFEIYNLMKESDEDICYKCQKKVNPATAREGSPSSDSEKLDLVFGHITSCPHLFCTECGPKYLSDMLGHAALGEWIRCPLCSQQLRLGMRELKMSDDPALQKDEVGRRKVVYRNPSTKIMQLVQDLLDNREKGDEKGRIKSVIFSGWTMHLDLIEAAFDNVGITHTRIDGKMNRLQRADSLTKFRDDPDVEAILVSISAGGVGLNLTSASCVYIMEPQFNPAAEAQAIDRIHRLGQEREVFCTRYIMQDSFEEKIVALQRKKQKIADLSMTQGKNKKQRAQDKIDDLKELFR